MDEVMRSPLALFPPPYNALLPLDPDEGFPRRIEMLRGSALVWRLGQNQSHCLFRRVTRRPPGLPLIVVLPEASAIPAIEPFALAVAEEARPQSVLPHHPKLLPEELTTLLRSEPEDLAGEFLDFLLWRGFRLDTETRRLIRMTVELSAELRTLSALAKGVYMSRRALGRRFKRRGLPVPSHWLQFCRLLRAVIRLQRSRGSVFEVACSLGYPDGFTMSNQMNRLVGVRPSEARDRLGWEWFVEAWLREEARTGGIGRGLPEWQSVRSDSKR
jgi:AraC-like DNA-binding protein